MNNNYQHYNMSLTTLSPVFIGDGKDILKKEYIIKDNKVIIPDMERLFGEVSRRGIEKEFIRFLTESTTEKDLGKWLRDVGINGSVGFTKYEFEVEKRILTDRKMGLKNILTFIKDPYGNPYIPGSSIKGMIRTALLSFQIRKMLNQNSEIKNLVNQMEEASKHGANRNRYLSQEIGKLEALVLHTLNLNEKRLEDALNSQMKGLIIGDSDSVDVKNLILAQKIDVSKDEKEQPFPIYRESLKPQTTLRFSISIDQTTFSYSLQEIFQALEDFNEISNQYFYDKFNRRNEKGTVYLGGGVGFLSKTLIYPIFQDKGLEIAHNVFKNTLNEKIYHKHKHDQDLALRLSPHVCKCTRYKGQLYNMGLCKLGKED